MGSWSVWCHPRRSFRRIEELEEECVRLAEERDEMLKEEINMREERIKELEAEVEKGEAKLKRHEKENNRLREELRLKSESLAEWEEMRPELERVAEAMERMEKMKEDYNRRIRKLQQQLDDARHGSSRRHPGQEEVSDILDFEGDTPFAVRTEERTPTKKNKNDDTEIGAGQDADWLQFL